MSRFRPSRNYVSGKVVFDGGPVDISGDLVVSGSVTANEYNVNVINTNVTHIDMDGSTKFGDTPDDTHVFTGSVFIDGPLSASSIIGGGATTPGAPNSSVQYNDAGAFAGDPNFTWNDTTSALTVTGDITASVNISGAFFYGDGSGLTGITATAAPAGLDTQIQFNDAGALGADADFTWSKVDNVLNVNGEITSSAMMIASTNPAETLFRVCSYDTPYLFSIDASASFDGSPRVILRNSNDAVATPFNKSGRGLFHLEQITTSSAAIAGNGLSVWTDTTGTYSSRLSLQTFSPPAGLGSEIVFGTSNGNMSAPGVVDNQALGRMSYGGWDGNNFYQGSLIIARATENWAFSSQNGTELQFFMVPTGRGSAANLKERIRFTSEGHLIVFPYSASNSDALPIETGYDKSAGAPALQVYGPTLFGSSSLNIHTFTGSVNVSGTVLITGSTSQLQTPEIQFDIDHVASGHSTGRIYWDDDAKTLTADMQGSDVRLQIGQEEHVYVRNASGVDIDNGDAVRIVGAAGANIQVEKAISEIKVFESVEQDEILGLATEDIPNNQSGYVTTFGQVRGINTFGFSEGDILYLSNTTSGSYTNTKPPAPYFAARVGIVEVVNATTGVVLVRPSEPIFLTDIASITSSNVPAGVPSYLCYDDTTNITSFTNELSGAFSGSFQGDGSALINLTIPSGTISRIDSTGQEIFYASISGAVAASTAGDYVRVGPGTYIEDTPINIPSGISVIGEAGWQVTSVTSSTGTGDVFTLSNGSLLKDFEIAIPSDSGSYAASFSGSGGEVASINFLSFYGGSGLRGSGYGQIGPGKTIGLEIRYSTGDCDAILEVTDGILAVEGVHVPNSAGSVDAGIRAFSPASPRVGNRGRFQGVDVNMGATNVEDAVVVGGTSTVVMQGINLFNVQNSFHLTSDSGSLTVTSGLSDPAINDVKVDFGLTGSGAITRITANMNGKFSIPPSWIPSDHAWTFFTEESDKSETSFQLWGGDLVVGHPEKGNQLQVGRGPAYATGYRILTTDATAGTGSDGANFIDVTSQASTKEGSTFTFQTQSADSSILWTSTREDENGSLLKHYSVKLSTSTGDVSGSYIFEIWNGTEWTEEGVQAAQIENSYRYANEVFKRSDNIEHIRVGITPDTAWALKTIDGTEGYWMRTRVASAGATNLATFEQLLPVPSHFAVNEKGQRFSHGLALWRKTISSAGNIFGEDGTIVDSSFLVGSGGSPPTEWTHSMLNNSLNSNGDAIMMQFAIPAAICTAYPMNVAILWTTSETGPITQAASGIVSLLPIQVSAVRVADPTGGTTPVKRDFSNTEVLTSKASQAVTEDLLPFGATLGDSIGNQVHCTVFENFDVSSYYEDDILLFRFELDDDGTPNQDITVWAVIVEGVAFTDGKVI
jgi:hypothetical protein